MTTYSTPLNWCCALRDASAQPPGPSEGAFSRLCPDPFSPLVAAAVVRSGVVWSPCWTASWSGLVGSLTTACGGAVLALALAATVAPTPPPVSARAATLAATTLALMFITVTFLVWCYRRPQPASSTMR